MLKECFDNVRKSVPLVHNITNYVTVNDVANIILACGASPIMSDEPDDVTDITSICSSLNLNIGTLHKSSIEAMYLAGKRANELGHPILLDPVGAGASALRTNTAVDLMEQLQLTVIRGNISEIKTLANGNGTTKGGNVNIPIMSLEKALKLYLDIKNQHADYIQQFYFAVAGILNQNCQCLTGISDDEDLPF